MFCLLSSYKFHFSFDIIYSFIYVLVIGELRVESIRAYFFFPCVKNVVDMDMSHLSYQNELYFKHTFSFSYAYWIWCRMVSNRTLIIVLHINRFRWQLLILLWAQNKKQKKRGRERERRRKNTQTWILNHKNSIIIKACAHYLKPKAWKSQNIKANFVHTITFIEVRQWAINTLRIRIVCLKFWLNS